MVNIEKIGEHTPTLFLDELSNNFYLLINDSLFFVRK